MDNPRLRQGIEMAQQGFYDQARLILLQVIRDDAENELAWLWLVQILDDPKRQRDCLRRVLHINPDNADAQRGLVALEAGRPIPEPGTGAEVVSEPEPAPFPFAPSVLDTVELPLPAVPIKSPVAEPSLIEPLPVELSVEARPESFIERARRVRTQPTPVAPTPVVVTPAGAEETPIAFTGDEILADLPDQGTSIIARMMVKLRRKPSAFTTDTEPSSRGFRLLDRRVLFGILGFVDLPLLALLLLFVLLRGNTGSLSDGSGASQQPLASAGLCEDLDLGQFTLAETLGGTLAVDTVYSGTEVLVTESVVIPDGLRLLVNPGATLVFTGGATIEVYGGLYACGGDASPVVFTAAQVGPGGWEGLRFYNPTVVSVLHNARVEYAGERAIYIAASNPALSNVTVAQSALFPISLDGNAVPDLSATIDVADNPVKGVEIRSGAIQAASAVWPDNDVAYVLSGPLRVDAGATLEVQPGVVVKFWQVPLGQVPGIWVRGLLKAESASFTSIYDSAEDAGGATYLEAVDPQPGDWGSITFFESSEKSYLRDVVIRYGGRSNGAVWLLSSSPELSGVTITDSAWYPLSVDANSFPLLEALTLTGNSPGDALEVYGGLVIVDRETHTWGPIGGETPVVRVVRDTIIVGPEATLTIHPGTVIKFAPEGRIVVQGVLKAVGVNTEGERIVFTSVHDDEYGADADGSTSPQDNRVWGGIVFDGADATSKLHNVIVRYAPVSLLDASPEVFGSQIALAPGAGLRMTPGSAPDLRAYRMEDNGLNGIAILTGTVTSDHSWARIGGMDDQVVRILEGEVTVGPGAILDIEAGSVIKATESGTLTVLGSLRARGRADQTIVFTSLNDDRNGGDTNGRLLNAAAGDWPGLRIGPDANVHLAYVGIYYAQVGLTVLGDAPPIVDEGRVHIAYGAQSLRCEARFQLPATYLIEQNALDVTRCPAK